MSIRTGVVRRDLAEETVSITVPMSMSKQDDLKNNVPEGTESTLDESAPSIFPGSQGISVESPGRLGHSGQQSKSPTPENEEAVLPWFESIQSRDWDRLENLLNKYDQKYYKKKRDQAERQEKEKEREAEELREREEEERQARGEEEDPSSLPPLSPRSRTSSPSLSPGRSKSPLSRFSLVARSPGKSLRRIRNSIHSFSSRKLIDPCEVVSPLVKGDTMGRTPLHLACLQKAPEKLILALVQAERLAAKVPDKSGSLPLHFAVQAGLYDHILNQIIKSYPNALKTKDIQGHTPVRIAVAVAVARQDEESDISFGWTTPSCKDEKTWQFRQDNVWSRVDFLLKHFMKQNKCVIPSEHGLILDGLEGRAPPKTINRFISTADKYLATDDDLAGSAISLCVQRQYCLDTLEYLLDNCREKTTIILDYLYKALISHYRIGCYVQHTEKPPYGKEIIDWATQRREAKEEEDDENVVLLTPHCNEWWEKLQHIIFYCAYGKGFRENKEIEEHHLVHAAMAIPVTPPSLIQLLLMVYPDARVELCPIYRALPVHITCTRWKYDLLQTKKDSGLSRVLKQLIKAEPEQLIRRYRGRLPLHMALDVGHSWSFVKAFVSLDKKSLGMRDLQTKLFPFQMAAIKPPSKSIAMLLRNNHTPGEWRSLSVGEKKKEYTKAEIMQNRRQIWTIFELLRHYPEAISGKVIYRDGPTKKNLHGAGRVSLHYLTWVYGRGSKGFKLQSANVKLLRDSILNAHISKALEPWWDRLKQWIWQECPSDSVPRTEEYLLHAALYNPDTPPLVIELLLNLFPTAATRPVPGSRSYPLHIAAATTAYHPQPFEIPYSMDSLHLTLFAYKGATRLTQHGRLPLHICIARGKTWTEIRPLVQVNLQSLKMRDPQTGLTPFQQMASFKAFSKENSLRFASAIEKETQNVDLCQLKVEERANFFLDVKKKHDLNVLTAVYELLRHAPSGVVSHGHYPSDSSVMSSEISEECNRQSKILGVAETLDFVLQQAQHSPGQQSPLQHSPTTQSLLSPEHKIQKSLSAYLSERHGCKSLVTPTPLAEGRTSVSSFLTKGSSSRSLVSRNSNAIYDDCVKPNYDDDGLSRMRDSFNSSILISPDVTEDGSPVSMTPRDNSAKRRGRKTMQVSIKLPDLD